MTSTALTTLFATWAIIGATPFASLFQPPTHEPATIFETVATSSLPNGGTADAVFIKDSPEVRLKRWGGEVDLGVRYKDIDADAGKLFPPNLVEWKGGLESVHAYPLQASAEMKDGGFEIEVVLNEKPTKNTFDFTIDGAEQLDFFYQGPLWQQEGLAKPTEECTDTVCTVAGETSRRPENVVGSYAVYHKTKRNHVEGQTNYGTGKAYHIYRPKAIDASGKEVWAVLAYASGILSVTVPQTFLDTAVYPVRVDPTFGYTTIGGTENDMAAAARVRAFEISETPASSGTVTKLTIRMKVATANGQIRPAIYVDDVSQALVTSGAEVDIDNTTAQWVDLTLTPAAIAAGTLYRLSIWTPTATVSDPFLLYNYYDATADYDIESDIIAYSSAGAFPDPYTTDATNATRRVSIYATYTDNAVTPARTIHIISNKLRIIGGKMKVFSR